MKYVYTLNVANFMYMFLKATYFMLKYVSFSYQSNIREYFAWLWQIKFDRGKENQVNKTHFKNTFS